MGWPLLDSKDTYRDRGIHIMPDNKTYEELKDKSYNTDTANSDLHCLSIKISNKSSKNIE